MGASPHDEPTVAERYEIVDNLDDLGSARLFRAQDRLLDREVTVVLHDEVDAWRREVDALSRLDHPHIAPLYDGDHTDDGTYTVLHLASTGSLAARVARRPVPADRAARWCLGLADALGHMHARDVAHGSTGPRAVLFDENDAPRWVGFAAATTSGVGAPDREADVRGLARAAAASVRGRPATEGLVAALQRATEGDADDDAVAELARLLDGTRRRAHRDRQARVLVGAAGVVTLMAALSGGIAVAESRTGSVPTAAPDVSAPLMAAPAVGVPRATPRVAPPVPRVGAPVGASHPDTVPARGGHEASSSPAPSAESGSPQSVSDTSTGTTGSGHHDDSGRDRSDSGHDHSDDSDHADDSDHSDHSDHGDDSDHSDQDDHHDDGDDQGDDDGGSDSSS